MFHFCFSFQGARIRLIADQIADAGYQVILPKLLANSKDNTKMPADGSDGWDGDAFPLETHMDDLMGWIKNYPWEGCVEPAVMGQVPFFFFNFKIVEL